MSDQLMPSQPQVERNVQCVHCGYNLRGLYTYGRCPECGMEVAHSLRGDLLQFADSYWLERLRLGMKVKLWNIVLSFVGGMITSFMVTAGLAIISTLLWLAGSGLGLWATFLITMQEPRIVLTENSVSLRKFVRGCAMFSLIGGVISFSRDAHTVVVFMVVIWIATLAGYMTSVCELIYLRKFAIRIPDEKLALSTKRIMWIGIFVVVLIFLAGLFIALASGIMSAGATAAASSGSTLLMLLGCFSMVTMLVLFLWYVRLLSKYKDAFEVAASSSKEEIKQEPVADV